MADSKILVQGQWMKIIDNGDGTYSFASELTPSTSIIGVVGIDQATANANKVVLKAGAEIVGKVGIDQTTNETTNKVMTQGIAMSRVGSAVVGSSLVIKASAGTLYGLYVFNTGTVDQYIQVHNTTTLPADTAVPILTIPLYAGGVLFLDYGEYGIPFAVGMVACNSTTIGTKTIGAADCWFVATYK